MNSNNRNRVTKKSQPQLKWFNNVAKSLGYASADLITDLVPASSQFVKSNYESTTELVQEMRQNRASGKRLSTQIANIEQVKILNTGLKNALDDIKSGNIYNKDRELAYMEQELDSEAGSIFGSDFGDDDFTFGGDFDDNGEDFESVDIDDSDPNVTNVKKVNVKNVNNTIGRSVNMLPLAKAMNNQTAVLSTAIHNSANAQAAISTEFMMMYNTNATSMVGGLTSINDNLSLLVNFQNDSMAKYIGASLKYYEDHLNKIDESFTILKDGFSGKLSEDTRRKQSTKENIDVFLSEGALDIKEYIKSVKANIKREAEANDIISSANMFWSDTETLKEIANNPLKTALTGLLKSTIPNSLKRKLGDVDNSFADFFPALINRAANLKDSSNPFLEMAGKILVPERRIKRETDIDLSNYNKGVIGFDGESKKALVEVIPTYLRKIESLMSGSSEKIYDYETGKFKTADKLKKDFQEHLSRTKTSGYGTFKSEVKNILNAFDIGSDEEKEEFYKELDKYLTKMTERGKAINPLKYYIGDKEFDELTDNGLFLDPDMRNTFSKVYKQLPKKVQNELLGSGINNSIDRLNKLTNDIEANPHKFGFASMYDGSDPNSSFTEKNGKLVLKKGLGLSGSVDAYGLSQLDYLRDIKFILSKGIVTYPNGSGGGTGTNINPHSAFVSEYGKKPVSGKSHVATPALKKKLTNSDAYKVDGFVGLSNLSDEQIAEIINKGKKEKPRGFKASGAYKFLDKYEKLHGVRDAAEKLFDTPVKVMEDVSTIAENTMFTLLHGIDEGFEMSELTDTLKERLFGDLADRKKDTFKFDTALPGNIAQFFADNKMQLKIGGGLGLLGSFFLPGGPIGGALVGMGAGIATKSDWFQRFIYGDEFKTEKSWKSGFFGKALNKFGGKLDDWGIDPKYASYLSAGGAGLGLLSSFFLPFGPVGGALLGLSGGIAASSNKFQSWLFGEKGEDDIRRGGFLSKFTNWFDVNVKESMMIKISEIGMNVSDFFHKSVSEPFLEAMGPLKHLFADVADKTKEMFYKGWEAINENVFKVFRDNVAKPFGETLEKFVLDPLKGFMSKALSFTGKMIGGIVAAPFKALGFVSDKVDKKYEREGLADEKKQRWNKDVQDVKQKFMKGELTWKDAKDFIKNRGDLKGEDRDRFLNELLPYRNLARDAKIERERKHAEKQAKRQADIDRRKGILAGKIQMGKETDYRYITEEQRANELAEIERNKATQKALNIFDQIKDTMKGVKEDNVDQVELLKEVVDKLDFLPKGFRDAFDKITNKETKTGGFKVSRQPNILDGKVPKKLISSMNYTHKVDGSHASGIDNVPNDGYIAELHEGEMVIPADQANKIRMQAGVKTQRASKVKGPLNDSNDIVNSLDRRLIGTKNDYIKRIARDTRTIAAEVKGQLDGVGSNVFKTRKILQSAYGIEDNDIKGSGNKSRQGFFGKLRHAIYKPLDFVKELVFNTIMKPIEWVTDKVNAVKDFIGSAFTTVKNLGKKVIETGWEVSKLVGRTALKVTEGLVNVGTKVASGLVDVSATVGKMFVKATGRVIADIYGGAKFLVSNAFKGVFKGLETVGKVALATADTIGHAANFVAKVAVDATKGFYTAVKDITKGVYGLVKDIGTVLFKGISGVFKGAVSGVSKTAGFLNGLIFGKDKNALIGGIKRVEIVGGRLDSVGSIEKPVEITNNNIQTITREISSKTFEVNVKSLPLEDQPQKRVLRPLVQKSLPIQQEQQSNVIPFPGMNVPNQKKMEEASKKKEEQEQKKKEQKEEAEKNKAHTTRKTADFMKAKNAEAKEKEQTLEFQRVVATSAVTMAKTTTEQYKFWDGIFGKNGKVSRFLETLGKMFTGLKEALGGLFSGGGMFGGGGLLGPTANLLKTLAPFAPIGGVILKQLLDAKENLNNGADNLWTALLGQGDETRLDADGSYIYGGDKIEGTAKYFFRPKTRGQLSKLGLQAIETGKAYGKAGMQAFEKGKGFFSKINPFKGKGATQAAGNVAGLLPSGNALQVYSGTGVSLVSETGEFIMDLPGNTSHVVSPSTPAKTGKGFATKAGDFMSSIAEKQKSLIDDTLRVLGNIVQSICTGVQKKFPKLASSVSSISKQVVGLASEALGNKNILTKFTTKLTNFFVELGLSASTIGVVDVALGAWDATTGFMEAANLFGVHTDQVDITMRVISSVMKTITKFNVMQLLDIVNQMVAEAKGINVKRFIATLIYQAIPYTDEQALKANQQAMDAEVAQYNADHGTNLSKEAYLDKVSPTVFTKIVGNDFTKNLMGTFSKNGAAKVLNKDRDDLNLLDRAVYGVSHTAKNIGNFFGMDGDKAQKNVADFYKNGQSIFTKKGARNNMGLNENAKVTVLDRFMNTVGSGVNTIANLFVDPEDRVSNKQALSWYTNARNRKANEKIEKANAVLADKNSGWFKKQFAKASKKRNEKKLGIAEKKSWSLFGNKNKKSKNKYVSNKSKTTKQTQVQTQPQEGFYGEDDFLQLLQATQYQRYASGEISEAEYKQYLAEQGQAMPATTNSQYDAMIAKGKGKLAGKGGGKTTKPAQKAVAIKNNAEKEVNVDKLQKEVDKSLNSVSKTMTKSVNEISKLFSKGMKKIIKSLEKDMKKVDKDISKGFNKTGNAFTKEFSKLIKEMEKIAKKTSKDLDKKTKKDVDNLETENKNVVKRTGELIAEIGKKVTSVIGTIKNIQLPTIELPNLSDMFSNLFSSNNNNSSSNKNSSSSSGNKNSSSNKNNNGIISTVSNWFSNVFSLGKGGTNNVTPAPVTHNKTENINNFTYYSQNDSRWGNKKLIGGARMADAGCGPTSLAMVMSQMHGKQITPEMIARMAPENLPGYSTPELFPTIANKFNVNAHNVNSIKEVKEQLKIGRPVIISGKGSGFNNPYSKEGHIVVATGLDGDNIIISDPRGRGLSKPYSMSELENGFNLAYTFTKPGHEDDQFIQVNNNNDEPGAIGDAEGNLGQSGANGGKVRLFEKIIQYARAFKGKLKYSMNTTTRNWINNNKLGADCSSFTQHVFKTVAGINIGANTGQQLTKGGTEIPISSAQPGDLILFKGTYNSSHPRGVSHVGIVSDNSGNMIDQGSSGAAPKERSYNSSYWKSKQLTAIRALSNPNQLVDPTVTGGNKAIGTVVATASGVPDVTGGGGTQVTSDSTVTTSSVPQVNTMGVFDLMSNKFQNYSASVWNGKDVDLFGSQTETTVESAGTGPNYGYSGTYPDTMNNFAYYSQADPRWADTSFDGTTLAKAGCGPTSAAMVMTQLTGRRYLPATILNAGKQYISSAGSQWALFPHLAKTFKTGIKESVTTAAKIKEELGKGNPVILSGRNGASGSPYTSSGHLVTAVGVDGDNILINDPRSPAHTKAYSKSLVEKGLRGGWSFSKTSETEKENVPSDGAFTPSSGDGSTVQSNLGANATNTMGAFDLMSNAFQNYAASVWNGKEVDLFATQTTSTDATVSDGTTPTAAKWNGTEYDLSKYDFSKFSASKQKHIMKMIHPVLETYRTHNLFPSVTIAQSVGEQGWNSTAPIVTKANNHFGIKCGSKWTGKSFSTKTQEEYQPGVKTTITDKFRAYDTLADGIIDRANFLSAKRYAKVLTASTPEQQIRELKAAGYATSSSYVNLLLSVLNADNGALKTLDKPKPPVPLSAGKGGDSNGPLPKLSNSINKRLSQKDRKLAGKGGEEKATSLSSRPVAMKNKELPRLRDNVTKLTQNNKLVIGEGVNSSIANSCVELINTVIAELKSINSNTANTVKAVSSIEIVPANASITNVNQHNTNVQSGKQKYNGRMFPQGTDKGYDLAKRIASFA